MDVRGMPTDCSRPVLRRDPSLLLQRPEGKDYGGQLGREFCHDSLAFPNEA